MSRGGNGTAGAALILAGGWVLVQVFAGNALERLGIAGTPTVPGQPAGGGAAAPSSPPPTGKGAPTPGKGK